MHCSKQINRKTSATLQYHLLQHLVLGLHSWLWIEMLGLGISSIQNFLIEPLPIDIDAASTEPTLSRNILVCFDDTSFA